MPSAPELARLKPGDVVKLGVELPEPVLNPAFPKCGPPKVGAERFWVRITDLAPAPISGVVEQSDMLLAHAHGIAHGDTIFFHAFNILAIGE